MTTQPMPYRYTDGQNHRLTLDTARGLAASTQFVRVIAEDLAIGGDITEVWLTVGQTLALDCHLNARMPYEATDRTGDTLTVTVNDVHTLFDVTRVRTDENATVRVAALTSRIPEIRRALTAALAVPAAPEVCEQHPDAIRIGGICGGCTQYGTPLPAAFARTAQDIPADTDPGERYPCHLGVFCDTCRTEFRTDFLVTDSLAGPGRLELIRSHVRSKGWQCDAAGDYCPACRTDTTATAIRTATLTQAIDAIESLPQDYECDPGRGDAVVELRRLLTEPAEEPTHEGSSPYHGGTTTHRGTRENCSGPDCEPEPVTLPYEHTDRDGDILTVRVAIGADAPSVLITAEHPAEDQSAAVYVPVTGVPELLDAIRTAAGQALDARVGIIADPDTDE